MNLISKRYVTGIPFEDFSLYGCPKCGCNTATQSAVGRGVTSNICPECNCFFLAFDHGINETTSLFPTGEKDQEGNLIFATVKKDKHPRTGILAHNPIDLDVEKQLNSEECCKYLSEETIDRLCEMRFVVKGRKSAIRIQRIFDTLSDEESVKAFVQCEIDEASFQYKYAEISLLFDFSDYSRVDFLRSLIMEDDTISMEIVLEGLSKSLNKEFKKQP